MEYADWEPYYRKILDDFGFSREADERSARVLDRTLGGRRIDPESLRPLFAGKEVAIAGNGPNLAD